VRGDELFVVATEHDQLRVMDRDTGRLVRIVPVGARPEQVVVGPCGAAFVTVRGGGGIARVEPGTSDVTFAPLGTEPFGLALSPDGSKLFVSLLGDGAAVQLAAKDLSLTASWEIGGRPRGLVAAGGRVVVTREHLDPVSLKAVVIGAGFYESMPLRQKSFVGGGTLSSLQDPPRVNGFSLAAAAHPTRADIYVTHTLSNLGSVEEVLEAAGGEEPASSWASLETAAQDSTVEATVSWFEYGKSAVSASYGVSVYDGWYPMQSLISQPVDINHSPTDPILFMVGQGSDRVLAMTTQSGYSWVPVVTPTDPTDRPMGSLIVGRAPKAIAFSDDGQAAYVLNAHDFTISAIDLNEVQDHIVDDLYYDGNLWCAWTVSHHAVAQFAADPLPSDMRLGRRVFTFAKSDHVTSRGDVACATCHFEGWEDKRTWLGLNGPRQTPALAGRLAGTEPFNWKGSAPSLKENIALTVERLGGMGLSDQELDSLALFLLDGLHPPANPNLAADGLTAEQLLGKALFEGPVLACSYCHLEGGSDGKSWNVGTFSALEQALSELPSGADVTPYMNTPSLTGLFATAPYLHDGSAATLYDVLDQLDGTMAPTALLTPEDKDLLVSYLLTL